MLGLCVDESMPWRAIDKLDADPELNPPMLSVNDFGNLAGVNPVLKNKNKCYLLNMNFSFNCMRSNSISFSS